MQTRAPLLRSLIAAISCRPDLGAEARVHRNDASDETADFLAQFRPQGPIRQLPPCFLKSAQVSLLAGAMDRRRPTGGVLRLFAGENLDRRKGVSLALRAIASLRDCGPAAHHTSAGRGPELAALRAEAARLGIAGQVTFHPGFSGGEPMDQLAASDAHLLSIFREATPNTLLEAFLAGRHPVVADASGAGRIVRQVGGHAAQATDPDTLVAGLADALRWCGANCMEMKVTAAVASNSVEESFARARYYASIDLFYAEAVEAARGRRA